MSDSTESLLQGIETLPITHGHKGVVPIHVASSHRSTPLVSLIPEEKKKKVSLVAILVILLIIYVALSMFYSGITGFISTRYYKSRPIPWNRALLYALALAIILIIVSVFTDFPLTRLLEATLD